MPQGALKKQTPSSKSGRSQPAGPKKGKRSIAPRKQALVRESGIRKKYSAGLTAKTEQNLAAKAGHLEMLAGGKKRSDKADGGQEKKGGKGGKEAKGGKGG